MAYSNFTLGQSSKNYNVGDGGGPGNPGQFGGKLPGEHHLRRGVGNAMGGQYNLAGMMEGFGENQFSTAGPAYGKALGFYQNLMGSSASQRQALSPAIRNINEGGVGARKSIRNRMGRSGSRDMALAEERRGRQGDINSMLAGAPLLGAEGAGRLSSEGLQRVLGAGATASNAYGSMGNMGNNAMSLELQRQKAQSSKWGAIGKWAGRIGAAFFTSGASEASGVGNAMTA